MVNDVPAFYETGTSDSLVSDANVLRAYNAHSNNQVKAFVNLDDGPHNEPCRN